METIAIIGTGAVGGYCAVKLIQFGFEVHCLCGSDYAQIKQNGLTLISQNQTITVPVNAYQNSSKMPRCDIIVISLKSTSNSMLKEILSNVMHENSVIVVLQNGIGIENEIAEYIAPEKIIGAMAILKVAKISPGVIKHFSFSDIEVAQYYADSKKSGVTKQVESVNDIIKKIGFNSTAMQHLPTIRWKKLAANIPINGLSVVLNSSTKELVENPASYALLITLTREVIDVAKKCGADIPDNFYQFRLNKFEQFKTMEKSNSSMKDDFDGRKPLELHAIYENAIKIAKENQVSMPLTEMLYHQLVYLNEKNLLAQNNDKN